MIRQSRLLQLHPFNGLFSRTTWVSWYQKGTTSLDLNEARDDEVLGWQWHQVDHMQTICTSLKTDNHIDTSSLFMTPNQPSRDNCQNFFNAGPLWEHVCAVQHIAVCIAICFMLVLANKYYNKLINNNNSWLCEEEMRFLSTTPW